MQLSPQGFAEHYENMTEDELEGEGRRTWLGNRGVSCPSLSPHIYIGGGGEEAALGRLQVAGGCPRGLPSRAPPPYLNMG